MKNDSLDLRAQEPRNEWSDKPPAVSSGLRPYLLEPGSLTDRLIATGLTFSVTLVFLGPEIANNEEAQQLGIPQGSPVFARHVRLSLNHVPVVVARSVCRLDCRIWPPILDRGGRSLGLTLFAPESGVTRNSLRYTRLQPPDPLSALAGIGNSDNVELPARCGRFLKDDAALLVTEAFLPALEGLHDKASHA